jgi:acetyltransferase-like isoleucine patch superfamily enzyme
MNNKWISFLRDPMPALSWTAYESLMAISASIGAIPLFLSSILWNIKIDFPYRAIGIVLFKKYPTSTIQIGKNSFFRSSHSSNLVGINRPCSISTHSKKAKIIIGNKCGLSGTVIGAYDEIIIGNGVLCGANTTITDFDWHPIQRETSKEMAFAPILIHDNVWLGMNTVVLKGVEIGENSIIGANSVVTKSIPPNVIAAGNPAKIISI